MAEQTPNIKLSNDDENYIYPKVCLTDYKKNSRLARYWCLTSIPKKVFQSTKYKLPVSRVNDSMLCRSEWGNLILEIFENIWEDIDGEEYEQIKSYPRQYSANMSSMTEPKTKLNMAFLDNWFGDEDGGDSKYINFSINVNKREHIYKVFAKLEDFLPLLKEL
jgi:hypothetical protein